MCYTLFLNGCVEVPESPTISTESQIEIVVKPGDTLTYLATQYNTTIEVLMDLNDITNADEIYIDQILVVPNNKITNHEIDINAWDDKLENQGYVQGIDLSRYQLNMDLDYVLKHNDNIDFVFVRSFYFWDDRNVDKTFDKFSQIASKNGIALGTYFWPTLKDKNSTKEELDIVIAKLKENQEKGIYYTMPIVMDIETKDAGGCGLAEKIQNNDQQTIECFEFAVNYLRDAGYEVMVYKVITALKIMD